MRFRRKIMERDDMSEWRNDPRLLPLNSQRGRIYHLPPDDLPRILDLRKLGKSWDALRDRLYLGFTGIHLDASVRRLLKQLHGDKLGEDDLKLLMRRAGSLDISDRDSEEMSKMRQGVYTWGAIRALKYPDVHIEALRRAHQRFIARRNEK